MTPGSTTRASYSAAGLGSTVAWKPRSAPEVQLLLLCARSRMLSAAEHRASELARLPLDWAYLLRLAMRHGLGALLHHNLTRISPQQIPPDVARHLSEFTEKSRAWNEHLAQEGSRTFQLLCAAGIPAVGYLDLTCGPSHQDSATLRHLDSADFLIAPRDAPRACQVLIDAGYSAPPNRGTGGESFDPPGYQWFARDGQPAAVLLYWTLARSRYSIKYDFEAIRGRARGAKIGDAEIPILCREDVALLTSVFAAQYVWHSLEWVWNVAEAAGAECFDWGLAERDARRIGAEKILRLGVFLAADLLDATVPEDVALRAAQDAGVRRVAPRVIRRLLDSAPDTIRSLESSLFHFRLRDTPRGRAAFAWRMLTTPTEADWKFVRLPRRLFFLYPWLVRPSRVLWRFVELALLRPLQRALGVQRKFSEYIPTAMPVVQRMLEVAELRPSDVLYDLGCGDGRIVIEAARRYGIRAVGVDLDPMRIAESRANARKADVERLVEFKLHDAMTLDISEASVVTLYLPNRANLQLHAKLARELRAGARVISHGADVGQWNQVEIAQDGSCPAPVYVWKI